MRAPASSAAARAERRPGICRRDVAEQHFVPDLQQRSMARWQAALRAAELSARQPSLGCSQASRHAAQERSTSAEPRPHGACTPPVCHAALLSVCLHAALRRRGSGVPLQGSSSGVGRRFYALLPRAASGRSRSHASAVRRASTSLNVAGDARPIQTATRQCSFFLDLALVSAPRLGLGSRHESSVATWAGSSCPLGRCGGAAADQTPPSQCFPRAASLPRHVASLVAASEPQGRGEALLGGQAGGA